MNAMNAGTTPGPTGGPDMALSRRLVRVGFWFFLAKGLLWLVAPAMAWFAIG